MIVPARFRDPAYPDSDGQPMAENTFQFEWITTLKWGCETLFLDRPDVFVAGDHLIYPVKMPEGEEENAPRIAPDVYVAFGRPKGHRGSYKVWEEGGIFPQVIFEVWSPGNRQQLMEDKREAYEEYGAEEYYVLYPELPAFVDGWVREAGQLVRVPDIKTWVSPRLGIRFEVRKGHLSVIRPDGTKFLTYVEIDQRMAIEHRRADQEAARAEHEAKRAEHEAKRAAAEEKRADAQTGRAEAEAKRAEAEAKRAESAEARAARLAAKLRELGLDPDAT